MLAGASHWLLMVMCGHVGSQGTMYWRQLRMVTWRAGTLRILSLLRLVTWSCDRLSDMSLDDITARPTAASITSWLLTSPQSAVLALSKAIFHDVVAGADARVAACFTVALYPWFYGRLQQTSGRNCIIILIIRAQLSPWNITHGRSR